MSNKQLNREDSLRALSIETAAKLAVVSDICRAGGVDMLFYCGMRTLHTQAKLYRKSRTSAQIWKKAKELHDVFKRNKRVKPIKAKCHDMFKNRNGLYEVILPEMERLFGILRKNPKPNIEPLIKEYIKE